jgi:hypothetical protein
MKTARHGCQREPCAPVFTDGDSTTREVAENTASGVNIGTAVGATDADDEPVFSDGVSTTRTLTYSLGGDDAESFSINTSNGQLRSVAENTSSGVNIDTPVGATHAALDFETKSSYSVSITVHTCSTGL